MINTFYGTGQLVTVPSAKAFLAAMIIGLLFGFALERAGFGSSRKLAGIFYLRDMTVLKVMFTALITGMLGLSSFVTSSVSGRPSVAEGVWLWKIHVSRLWPGPVFLAGIKLFRVGQPADCQNSTPRKQIAARGTQYFRHIVITWSIRNRGSVQRTQIITVTPRYALAMKLIQPARLARKPPSRQPVSP